MITSKHAFMFMLTGWLNDLDKKVIYERLLEQYKEQKPSFDDYTQLTLMTIIIPPQQANNDQVDAYIDYLSNNLDFCAGMIKDIVINHSQDEDISIINRGLYGVVPRLMQKCSSSYTMIYNIPKFLTYIILHEV